MNKRQMCPSLSCHYPMSLLCPNVCLVWVGQTLNMLFLVKSCSFFQKCDKKVAELLFFSSYCVLCTIFLGMSPQKACWTYLGTKSTFKAAQKLTPSQFCSKKALNEALHYIKQQTLYAIVVSFFYHVFRSRLIYHFDGI